MSGAFLFGKLPAHGDFVCRGLGADERDAADRWLSAEMALARDRLGEAFERGFDAAPPWRFVREDGDGWTAGALAPSADSVGRRFPILLGRRGLAADETTTAATQCEDALYQAVAGSWTADRLVDEIEARAPELGPAPPGPACWWVDGGDEAGIAPLDGRAPSGLLVAVLAVAGGAP